MTSSPIKSARTLALEAGGSGEPAEVVDPDADRRLADLRRLARMGGCPWKEPCGCANAQCLRYGGDATPTRCVGCLTGARQLEGPTRTP